jgi:predicted  nucleic acid-binding Zn-ribbon protein
MDRKNIEILLEAQGVDRERLTLLGTVYDGVTKRNLDSATKLLTDTKNTLLSLETDAQILSATFGKITKAITDTINAIDGEKTNGNEEYRQGNLGSLLQKISILESQLGNIERQIRDKSVAFDRAKDTVRVAQTMIISNTAEFEKQKKSIAGAVSKLDKQFDDIIKNVDEKLATRYKNIRRQKGSSPKDIVVQITPDDRCGGCYFEIPLSQVSKIKTNGYIVCEECGKIIYESIK